MRAVINRRLFDTTKAEAVAAEERHVGGGGYRETLYKTRSNRWFLVEEPNLDGGAWQRQRAGELEATSDGYEGERVRDQVIDWLVEHSTIDVVLEHFTLEEA